MLSLTTGAAFLALVSALVEAAPSLYERQGSNIPTRSPTSCVKGKAFERWVTIWLENTDYDKSVGDTNIVWLAKKGLTLSNYFAVTHPSEPNYLSSFGGDYWGINNDAHLDVPANVSTVLDLLDERGISYGTYQEDLPSTGFVDDFPNPRTKANMYVRKHNPFASYASVTQDVKRLGTIKSINTFYEDLNHNKLPQWIFITPNMTSDGHDTSITTAGAWTRKFLEPLLNDKRFMKDTLVLVTWDENHTYTQQNRVMGLLLGDALPKHLVGKTDDNFYTHYSEIATVEANWDLHTLGRYDTAANVFEWVAKRTGDKLVRPDGLSNVFLNQSYAGIYNDAAWAPQPVPNVDAVVNGRYVLPSIVKQWRSQKHETVYKDTGVVPPSFKNPPVYPVQSKVGKL